ncbi:MAG: DNA polymerase III subunit gamma/tau [Janthinobacterium lividum]
MAYQVLARKYRPQRFADVAGQDHVTRTLQNALEQNRIAHGYIFSGHRGIGKTTIARILASALNCRSTIGSKERPTPEPCGICESCTEVRAGNAVDVIEIDAATNRGIDEIRELRDAARYRPARDRFKIYILDEAHQITDAAFNALLKTLEEPPDHIVFMMATTEPENIPQTIRSRCQHFSFHAVKLDDILIELRGIAAHEGVLADEAALALLAEAGDGSMRDALSIMDQAIASAPLVDGKAELSAGEIRELMGTVPNTVFEDMLESIAGNDSAAVMSTAGRLLDAGNSSSQIARQFVRYLRNCIMAKIASLTEEHNSSDLLQISPDERRRAVRSAMLFTEEELTRFLQVMLRTFDDLGFRQEQRLHLELGLIKLVHLQRLLPVEEFLSQLPRPAQGSAPRTIPAARVASPSAPARVTAPSSSRFTQSQPQAQPVPQSTASLPNTSASLDVSPPKLADAPEQVSAAPFGATTVQGITAPQNEAEPARERSPSHVSPLTQDHAIVEPDASTGQATHEPTHKVVLSEGSVPQTIFTPMPQPDASTLPPAGDATLPAEQAPLTDAAQMQAAAVEALYETKKHNSAAEQLEESTWSLADGEVQISTSLSKALMGTIFRPDVEAIIKTALRSRGLPAARLVFIPAALNDKPKAAKKPRTGSAQAKALEHPTVQAAQRLFNAEITNVFDLRKD